MDCRDYPAGACEYDQGSANILDQAIYNGDMTATAQIQQEMFNRPPALAIDLLQRTINGQIPGSLDSLHIDPIIGTTDDGRYYDSGQRAVNLTKPDQTVDTVAILQAAPPPQVFYDRPPIIQPWNFALGIIVGSPQGGGFSPWNQENHQWQPRFQPLPQDHPPLISGSPGHPFLSTPGAIQQVPRTAPGYPRDIQPNTAAPNQLTRQPRATDVQPWNLNPAPVARPHSVEQLPLPQSVLPPARTFVPAAPAEPMRRAPELVAPPARTMVPAAPAEPVRRAPETPAPQHELHLNPILPANPHPAPPPAERHEKKPWEK